MPDDASRLSFIQKLLSGVKNDLTEKEFKKMVKPTRDYSFADISAMIGIAVMYPMRELDQGNRIDPS